MPIRFDIDLPCQPREDLAPDQLSYLIGLVERASSVRERFTRETGEVDPARMRFRERVVSAAGGESTRERTVAELLAEAAPLEPLAFHCTNCPASVQGGAYGCSGAIELPLSAAAQCWLLERLGPDGSRSLELFRGAVEAHRYGEAPVLAAWRRAGFLEGETAPVTERGDFVANADMILAELLLVGDLMPNHLLGVLLHLNALRTSDGRGGDDFVAFVEQLGATESAEDAPSIEYTLLPEQGDDPSVADLKLFLFAAYTALSLQVTLRVRL
jgi:hypothetical protein